MVTQRSLSTRRADFLHPINARNETPGAWGLSLGDLIATATADRGRTRARTPDSAVGRPAPARSALDVYSADTDGNTLCRPSLTRAGLERVDPTDESSRVALYTADDRSLAGLVPPEVVGPIAH